MWEPNLPTVASSIRGRTREAVERLLVKEVVWRSCQNCWKLLVLLDCSAGGPCHADSPGELGCSCQRRSSGLCYHWEWLGLILVEPGYSLKNLIWLQRERWCRAQSPGEHCNTGFSDGISFFLSLEKFRTSLLLRMMEVLFCGALMLTSSTVPVQNLRPADRDSLSHWHRLSSCHHWPLSISNVDPWNGPAWHTVMGSRLPAGFEGGTVLGSTFSADSCRN